MLKPLAMLATVLTLAACDPASSPGTATNDVPWPPADGFLFDGALIGTTVISGVPVGLGISKQKNYALLRLAGSGGSLTFAQAEAGVQAASKCTAIPDSRALAMVKGDKNAAIPFDKIPGVSPHPMPGGHSLRFDLKC